MNLIIVAAVVFALAVLMTMTGRGGGNFYVLVLVLAGQAIHQAATTGQLILMLSALTGMLVFHKHKMVDWKLALVIDPPTDLMAFVGGYLSAYVSGITLKFILAGVLVLAGFLMLLKVKNRPIP
ncbi:MAG: sulfite exporter TauE/SafE family protein, partial [Spirochaetales bacterium]|nr:sulfite exporter TauE/SafE family protein [Spirochaetales bacterium]